jgi:D-alanyl-D-alanine carboxypeptidase/D-alanyl-D-alanine-endopeptidase (penicillin-binding protein 4)
VDGTLKSRLAGKTKGRVWGKTGMLEQVASIAGYIRCRSGRMVSFCVITNNHPDHKRNARRTIDALVRDIFNHL